MNQIDIVDGKGKVGQIALDSEIVDSKVNKAVLYEAVKRQLAGKHHGTVRTKTRSEVLRTSKKLHKQKGTGGARHGSRKSSPFVGGGRVFGPKPRDYSLGMTKKVRALAFREALKAQLQKNAVTVVQDIPLKAIKTKDAKAFLSKLGFGRGLIILTGTNDVHEKSLRNIRDVKVARAEHIELLDILKFPKILFTAEAFEGVKNRYLS
jgi:large subunit ribosomal protein L4